MKKWFLLNYNGKISDFDFFMYENIFHNLKFATDECLEISSCEIIGSFLLNFGDSFGP